MAVAGTVRKPIVGGNWKCNGTMTTNGELIEALNAGTWDEEAIDVVICPVALQALPVKESLKPSINVALQNVSANKEGAFTGEMSAEQIKDAGLDWVAGPKIRDTNINDIPYPYSGSFSAVSKSTFASKY